MIKMHQAFGSQTTTGLLLYRNMSGYWNEENQWETEGYSDPVKIRGTPIPIGERQTGTHGETLTPDTTGERFPASMKFTTEDKVDIHDVIFYQGIPYKMSRKGDFSAAGYHTNVGVTLRKFQLTSEGKLILEEME